MISHTKSSHKIVFFFPSFTTHFPPLDVIIIGISITVLAPNLCFTRLVKPWEERKIVYIFPESVNDSKTFKSGSASSTPFLYHPHFHLLLSFSDKISHQCFRKTVHVHHLICLHPITCSPCFLD